MGKISEIFNFDNIGGKIKNFAKWSCWITILLIWIVALIFFFVLVSDKWRAELCWIPLVSAIVGPIIVWIGSWTMYAFGEFVEDIHAMRNKEEITEENKETQTVNPQMNRNAIPTRKAKQYMEQGVAPERFENGYICPVCKMIMDSMSPCERCKYIPPVID